VTVVSARKPFVVMAKHARFGLTNGWIWTTLLREYEGDIDTILIPPRTQYGATQGKAQKRNPLIYAAFASSCKPLQRMNYHS
jgi:hypothetical protein